MKNILDLLVHIHKFKTEAHQIFSKHESSKSRKITLDQTKKKLNYLSLKQDNLLKESLDCIEQGLNRSAHIMAWASFIDFLEQKLASDGLTKVKTVRKKWNKYKTIEELRENIPEAQLVDVARDVKLISKTECKTFQGLLSKRNECAHPSNYEPGLNESLGYVSELLKRIEQLQNRKL